MIIKKRDICDIEYEDEPDPDGDNSYNFCPHCGYRLTLLRR